MKHVYEIHSELGLGGELWKVDTATLSAFWKSTQANCRIGRNTTYTNKKNDGLNKRDKQQKPNTVQDARDVALPVPEVAPSQSQAVW